MQRELRNAGEERRQVAAHRQTGTEAGDNAAQQRLHNANAVLWLAQLDVIGPQCGSDTASEHADDHPAVDALQRRALKADNLEVAPLLRVQAEPLQYMATPAGKFPGYRPEGTGQTKVVGREDPCGNHRG
ncbi:hypothetical protein D3C72_1711900 [compost metagenome]